MNEYLTKHSPADPNQHPCAAFSLLELLVALVITALVSGAVLLLLQQARSQEIFVDYRMTQHGLIQTALDRLFDDLTSTTYADGKVEITHAMVGWQDTSQVSLEVKGSQASGRPARQIDWLAAPHDEGDDLILYRRDRIGRDAEAMYIPLCENIHSFVVEMLDRRGESMPDPNLAASMFEVEVDIYRDPVPNPERLVKFTRIYCPKRFD